MVSISKANTKAQESVLELEKTFRAGGVKKANILVDLLAFISPATPACSKAIHAARRTLSTLEKPASVERTLAQWVEERRNDYAQALVQVLSSNNARVSEIEAAVAAAAITHASVWRSVVCAVLEGSATAEACRLIAQSFIARFGDLRYTALELMGGGMGSIEVRLDMLAYCSAPVEVSAAKDGDAPSTKDLRKAFGAAWSSVLADRDILPSHRREILGRVTRELIPNMTNPLQLADFLNDSYNNGQDVSIAIAALDGLFVLISKHGLDYPLFYQKLYALMSPEALFFAEGRQRFLELAASFLRQGAMLPGGLVASFIKRLVRRALMAPPAGALWCLRLALDLLYKHPQVSFLVHRSVNLFDEATGDPSVGKKRPRAGGLRDPFDDSAIDPAASHANESCLWELETLRNHVSPAVSRLVSSFSTDVRKKPAPPPGALMDYADLTFEDIFQAEFKRRSKSSHMAYDAPGAGPQLEVLNRTFEPSISWT